ncbi:hypothetical protein [Paenibacillus abyssi]|uniref:Uncharacterized protein n=1 Tax=Paenibacillus abyssi TaxID=1340531 RepID=A0A917G3K5_9BACL|nr:hypothetical protein [Paenibacillus abyssi]GGG21397.1 hypothetical protein GCM10010916_42630 [Paenibacillus abyssi]
MNTEIQTDLPSGYERKSRKSGKGPVIMFLVIWVLLIGAGIAGTMWYTERTKAELTAQLERQTAAQIATMQQEYEQRIVQVEEGFAAQMSELGGKVDALNELLTFTKDNANDKTDNSNKLYTQINDVKKKLNELQKSLDVLK